MVKIKEARVLITGASSGIGRATAFEFAAKGAKLILTSRRFECLNELAEEIKQAFPHIPIPLVIPADLTKTKEVKSLIERSVDHFGGIDILINNAGFGVYGDTERTTVEEFRLVMEVNFLGAVRCMLEVLPIMKRKDKGLIINVASVTAKHGVPYLGAYSASKAALVALSQSLRAELVDSHISIMIVYPGYTQTDFFKKEKKLGGAHRPPEPYTSPQKVAKAIVRASQREKRDLFLSMEGKALTLFKNLMPWLVERAMERIAFKLRDKKEVSHE
jgi:short-subunit dehydrogenase